MPHLYKNIEGWFTFASLYDEMVNKYPNGYFAEVGCWFGRSSTYLLEKIQETNSETVVDFYDSWLGGEGEPERDYVLEHGIDSVYNEFCRNVSRTDFYNYHIYREFSAIVPRNLPDEIYDFIFIDAGHRGWQCYEDLTSWYPKLKSGGTIAGHDFDFEDVRNSVDRFCDEQNLHYISKGSPEHCWIINK